MIDKSNMNEKMKKAVPVEKPDENEPYPNFSDTENQDTTVIVLSLKKKKYLR
jgi:hypothetical protein